MTKFLIFLRLLVSVIFRGPSRLTRADNYLNAWNNHDVEAILSMTGQGSYEDPLTETSLSGEQLRAHIEMLFKAFPDLRFELDGEISAGQDAVAARYVLHATHTGELPGDIGIDTIDPTGKTIALPGTIFFEFTLGKAFNVHNLFDQKALADELGFQGFILPQQMGDYSFGAFYRLNRGSKAPPEAIGLTWIRTKGGDKPFQHVADITNDALESLSKLPGFVTGIVGARLPDDKGEGYGFTISAWETLEAIDSIRPDPAHQEVVRQFMKEKVAYGTHSRVYQLVRTKPLMIACEACGKKNNAHNKSGKCSACGDTLDEAPAYW